MRYIIKRKITEDLIEASKKIMLNKVLNRSIMEGERNLLGTLGEICYLDVLHTISPSSNIIHAQTYDYDIILKDAKIDVKTKQRTVEPRDSYDASIVAYSKDKQKCDAYAFTSITVSKTNPNDFIDFYLIGHISKSGYFNNASFKRKGDLDGNNFISPNKRFRIREDCYNLTYGSLHCFDPKILPKLDLPNYECVPF